MEHFLDANILVAKAASWDRHRVRVEHLFEKEEHLCTSIRTFREARGVIETFRRCSLKFLNYMDDEISNFGYGDPERFVRRCRIEFFRQKYFEPHQQRAIENFQESFHQPLIQTTLLGGPFENLRAELINVATQATAALVNLCSNKQENSVQLFRQCPTRIALQYPEESKALLAVFGYRPDVEVLLDAHHIALKIVDSELNFVTLDYKHILNNKIQIEEILPLIHVMEPP